MWRVKTTTETVDKAKQASQNKIAERITGAGQSDPAPAAPRAKRLFPP